MLIACCCVHIGSIPRNSIHCVAIVALAAARACPGPIADKGTGLRVFRASDQGCLKVFLRHQKENLC